MLRAHDLRRLADIRLIPASTRYSHFGRDRLAAALREAGVAYRHFRDLGGHRRPRADSPNAGWRNAAFRGYADYMATIA